MLTNNTRREEADAANPRVEQRLRPHHRDHRGRRRLRRHQGHLGDPGAVRRPVDRRGRRDLLDRDHRQRLVRHARQLRDRRRRAALGRDRRQHALGHRPHRRALGAGHRGRGPRHLAALLPGAGRRRALRPLPHARTWRRSSSRSSIPATAATTGRASAGRPTTRTSRPAGPTSTTPCRSARRWSPSPSRAAAGSAEAAHAYGTRVVPGANAPPARSRYGPSPAGGLP